MAKTALSDSAVKALKLFEDGKDYHDRFVQKVDECYDAFDGVLTAKAGAEDWVSKLHPPYIKHIINTTLAGLVDDRFAFRIRPAPRFYDQGEYQRVEQGAEAHEILHRCQLKQDNFNEFMRPFVLQNMIAGVTVAKTSWKREIVNKPSLELAMDENGFPKLVEAPARPVPVYDGPHTEVVDVRDFFWHEAAPCLEKARWVAHRVWMSLEEIRRLGKQGVFQNTADLEKKDEAHGEDFDREIERELRSRTKDMVEVLEIWYQTADGIRTCTLGNRRVELVTDRPNPFWHGQYPFTVCTTEPYLFRVSGDSQVAKIKHLQDATHDITNQTIDNLRLINNFMLAVRPELMDGADLKFGPGEILSVEDPQGIQPIKVDPIGAQIALPHLQRLEQQMQNLAGSQPFTTTSEGQMNATTATQAALVTDLASRSIQAQKNQIYMAYGRIGQIRTELNQQFIRVETMVTEIGLDNEQEMVRIGPYLLGKPGDYMFDIDPMAESQMRAERRAEAQGLLQMMMQYAPVAASLAGVGAATMVNMDEVVRHYLEAHDILDLERFFTRNTPPAPAGPQQQPAPETQGPGGVTAPQSIDPAVSPSNQASISPSQFMQRALASQGGMVNGPTPG